MASKGFIQHLIITEIRYKVGRFLETRTHTEVSLMRREISRGFGGRRIDQGLAMVEKSRAPKGSLNERQETRRSAVLPDCGARLLLFQLKRC